MYWPTNRLNQYSNRHYYGEDGLIDVGLQAIAMTIEDKAYLQALSVI